MKKKNRHSICLLHLTISQFTNGGRTTNVWKVWSNYLYGIFSVFSDKLLKSWCIHNNNLQAGHLLQVPTQVMTKYWGGGGVTIKKIYRKAVDAQKIAKYFYPSSTNSKLRDFCCGEFWASANRYFMGIDWRQNWKEDLITFCVTFLGPGILKNIYFVFVLFKLKIFEHYDWMKISYWRKMLQHDHNRLFETYKLINILKYLTFGFSKFLLLKISIYKSLSPSHVPCLLFDMKQQLKIDRNIHLEWEFCLGY